MNFGFTEEQELLRSEVRKFLDDRCTLEQVRAIVEDEAGPGFSREVWKQISELGWVGLTIPEEYGGAGLGFVDLVVVLEETGRSLFPSPLVSTTLASFAIRSAGSAEQKARWLPRLADGTAIGTVALVEEGEGPGAEGVQLTARADDDARALRLRGEKTFVGDAGAADLFVVAFRRDGRIALAVVERDAPGVSAEDWRGMDLTKRTGRLRLDDVRVGDDALLERGDESAFERLLDAGATLVTVEGVGAAEAALQLTVGYAGQRIQFGRPIGQFQGVKHPLAEMYVDTESTKSLGYYAAWCLDEDHVDRAIAASRAKACASESLPRIGLDTVQLHGGIGYTWEYDAHLFLKRARWLRPAFGDADWHYERVARLGGL